MKLKVAVAIGLIFILLTGCRSVNSELSGCQNTRNFKIISYEVDGNVIYDTRTGVEYWQCGGYSNVLTVLVDAEGKPLIYEEKE